MSRSPRGAHPQFPAALVAFVALSALLLGCGRSAESTQEVRDWRLGVDGAGTTSPVSLPAHLDGELPASRSRYTLRAHVALGADLRGRDLVFALPSLPAIASLRVNGAAVDPLDVSPFDVYRRAGPQAWRIPQASGARDGAIDLELDVANTWPMSGWIEGTPRLSATPAGDAAFRHVSLALDAGNALAVGTMVSAGFTYLILFLFAPARRHYGWFALQALCAAHYPLFIAGVTQVFGKMDGALLAVSQPWAALAGLQFTYSAFKLGKAPRWPIVTAAVASSLGFVIRDPFDQVRTLAPITCAVCLAIVLLHLSLLARIARQPSKRAIALILAASWIFVLAALTIDGGAFVGLGGYLQGYRIGSWALAFVAMAQSAALSREHIESLRNADGLNTTLAQRLAEIESLNDELRQRIGERTREVRAALGRASHVSLGPVVGAILVGRYRIERLLGVGGMGRVYEVTSVRDDRRRALKVVGNAPTDEALSRFAREAELAARVVHPNVVSIVDFDVGEDGLPFIVMDLVAGVPLEGHRHRFGDVPWAFGLLAQIAAGLEAIHARGIVHRDLKPANVLLSDSESVARITDFGISCAAPVSGVDRAARNADAPSDAELTAPATMPGDLDGMLTKTGLVLGTPAYMAPELAHGARDATPAADAFGFAVMAYELLAGRRPFAEPAFLTAQRGERAIPMAPLGALVPEVPTALADLVDRALRCDPPLRPSSHTFARAFCDVLAGSRAA